MNPQFNILCGNALTTLPLLDAASVHSCVTSPPYFNQRDYGIDGQIGLENSIDEYIANLVSVFDGVKRVLRDDGTLWVNIGDTFYNYRPSSAKKQSFHERDSDRPDNRNKKLDGLKEKDLIGIPWKLAFALRDAGWWLRQEIIWHKLNPMPASVSDRCTVAHEQIFMFTKSKNYYYDKYATQEWVDYGDLGKGIKNSLSVWTIPTSSYRGAHFATYPVELPERCIKLGCPLEYCPICEKNAILHIEKERIPTRPGRTTKNIGDSSIIGNKDPSRHVSIIKQMFYAKDCDCACNLAKPVILDPFSGAATTGVAAIRCNRSYIGIELNPEYAQMSWSRLNELRRST